MTRLLHSADLHLSRAEERGERAYSLAVLDDIVALAAREKVDYLLICGDLFDSFDDAEALRGEVRARMARLPDGLKAIYIPGNHEELRLGGRSLAGLDLGALTPCHKRPFDLLSFADIEFLCIPHQRDYRGYHQWSVPAKQAKRRVALAHGLVSGMDIYTGPGAEDEEPVGAIDADLFARFGVDYAALGHIHQRLARRHTTSEVSYPGSPRVWRRGESGPRSVNLVELGSTLRVTPVPVPSAGAYREYRIPLGLDGSLEDLGALAAEWSDRDWVDLCLEGIVEDENVVAELERRIKLEFTSRVRWLEVFRDQVETLPGILTQPLARRFLEAWKRREPAPEAPKERRLWLKARELGLREIKQALTGRA